MNEKYDDTKNPTIQMRANFRIGDLNELEAKMILQRLIAKGGSIREAVQEEIDDLIFAVDVESITSEVYGDLDGIWVEDLWDRSGASRYGYTDPSDEAGVMIEEVLTPHIERIRHYHKAGMANQAQQYCLAVLEGIAMYSDRSSSEFKDWAPDEPATAFSLIYFEWKNGAQNDRYAKDFEQTVQAKFPEWSV